MMEPVVIPDEPFPPPPPKPWALTGCRGRPPRTIRSLYLGEGELESVNYRLGETYGRVESDEPRCETARLADADVVLVAYGMCARVCREAVALARGRGHRVGLIRPITLWPFPKDAVAGAAERARAFLAVEMSMGQMVEDVRLALDGRRPVGLLGRPAAVPEAEEICERAVQMAEANSP
jgi:2-oxoglutarate ferredoxin oxidoreductase subunit alpha